MNTATKIVMALIMLAGLCMGCGKSETPEPEKQDGAATPEAVTEKWAPETATEKPAAQDPHDHSGHDHSGHNH